MWVPLSFTTLNVLYSVWLMSATGKILTSTPYKYSTLSHLKNNVLLRTRIWKKIQIRGKLLKNWTENVWQVGCSPFYKCLIQIISVSINKVRRGVKVRMSTAICETQQRTLMVWGWISASGLRNVLEITVMNLEYHYYIFKSLCNTVCKASNRQETSIFYGNDTKNGDKAA